MTVFGVIAFTLLLLTLGAGTARADGSGNADQTTGACAQDVAGFHLNCTANDVSIANATNITIHDDGCAFAGDTVTFTADFEMVLTAQERFDLGIWFANDGDPNGDGAYTGSCTVATPAYAPDPPWLDLDQAIAGQEGDTCGDIDSGHSPLWPSVTMTVVCVDDDGDGFLDLPYVTSWRIPGANDLCAGPLDAYPGTPAKCKADAGFNIEIPVPHSGTIEVIKDLAPASDPGLFNLQIDGVTEKTNASDGGSTGPVVVTAGISTDQEPIGDTHTVGEAAGSSTNLADYNSSISCIDEDGDTATATGAGPLNVFVEPDDEWVCTITNTNNRPKLTLIKKVINDDGGTLKIADFKLYVDATEVTSGVMNRFDPGSYTASESNQPGYAASVWTGDCAEDGSITLARGDDKTCYITNDDIRPKLTVIKRVVNNDGGSAKPADFTMQVTATNPDSASFPGAASPGTTVGVDAGAYSVDEVGLPGYVKSLSPDCTGTIAIGEHKTCTITNNDKQAYITVTKVVHNDHGGTALPGDFNLTLNGQPVTSGVKIPVDPGTYVAAETLLPGYTFNGFTGDCDTEGTLTVALGQSKTCTLANTDIAPTLTLVKTVVNDDGGTLGVGDFALYIDGQEVTSGVPVTLMAGTHTASELSRFGYEAGTWGTDCSSDGSITLLPGMNKTCTITNDDIAPQLKLIKEVVNDNDRTSLPDDWTLSANFAASKDDLRLVFLPNPNSPSGTMILPERTPGTRKPIERDRARETAIRLLLR